MTHISKFFVSRSISTFGDSLWVVSLPLYFLSLRKSEIFLGSVFSALSFGIILGFIVSSKLWLKKAALRAVFGDLLQSFGLISLLFYNLDLASEPLFLVVFFIFGIGSGIWTSSVDVMLTRVMGKELSGYAQKWNYLSSTLGPVLGATFGGAIFHFLGIKWIIYINLISFCGQLYCLYLLSFQEEKIGYMPNRNGKWYRVRGRFKPLVYFLTVVPVGVKFLLLGLFPFIPYLTVQSGLPVEYGGIFSGLFAIGSVFGAVTIKANSRKILKKYFFSATVSLVLTLVLIGILLNFASCFLVIGGLLLILGISTAIYTVYLRQIRHIYIEHESMPAVVSFQGSLARLGEPAGNYFYSVLFTSTTMAVVIVPVVIVIAALYSITYVLKELEAQEC